MDTEHLYWLRERLVADPAGHDEIRIEYSYDNGMTRVRRFFRVPEQDVIEARALYQEWGGSRPPECRIGTTAKGQGKPFAPSIHLWREK